MTSEFLLDPKAKAGRKPGASPALTKSWKLMTDS